MLDGTGFVGRVRRQPPPGKTRVRCSKTALPPNFHLHTEGAGCWQSASVLHCPAALRLRGPTELVLLLDSTGFVGRVRRQPPPGKMRVRCSKLLCPQCPSSYRKRRLLAKRERLTLPGGASLARAYRDCAILGRVGFVGQQKLRHCLMVRVL